jgi:staphyloferrin B biosynthesis citrate synthase
MSSLTVHPADLPFHERFRSRQFLLGTFIKTVASPPIEIMGSCGFDFVIIDAEHAPFDRSGIDQGVAHARASGVAGLVRVATQADSDILTALDCGAAGVLVPHIRSPLDAQRLQRASRYQGGRRGFSSAGRAGGYGGTAMWDHIRAQDRQTVVIAMIEDPEALECIDGIAAIDGIDGLFVGRGDLAVTMGVESAASPQVLAAVENVAKAGIRAGKTVCIMADDVKQGTLFQSLGVTVFIVGSDQGFMRQAAKAAVEQFSSLAPPDPNP